MWLEGRDTILFVGKGGEHRKLTGVYFIPRLTANLVSLGQLDEVGCFISIECASYSKSAMIDDGCSQGQPLGQDRRSMVACCKIYILELEIEQLISLSARTEEVACCKVYILELEIEQLVSLSARTEEVACCKVYILNFPTL